MIEPRLILPVLKVRQPIGDFYIASIRAQDLVDISYKDVRRLASEQRDVEKYLGIQREVKKSRIKQIKKYIEGRDATFPTAVIVSIDERCAIYDEQRNSITLTPYIPEDDVDDEPIPYDKIAKVIDGQHRIAAFMDEDDNWEFAFDDRQFDINISIFIGADVSEQANIFATVNLAQTKVNKSLVYDLTDLAKTPSPQKTCHNVAVMLDRETSSPFFERIKRLGTATPGRAHEPLTQASFVEALVKFISPDPVRDRNNLLEKKTLVYATAKELQRYPFRNLFIDDREVDIAEILFNFFSAARQRWPSSWEAIDRTGNLLPRSNAFKALMKFLKEDVYLDIVGVNVGAVPTQEQFQPYFDAIDFEDSAFTTRNFSPGSTGQSVFLKMLRKEIALDDMTE